VQVGDMDVDGRIIAPTVKEILDEQIAKKLA
jgi:hypothetical protein